jgi:hypothetical protein
VRRIRGRPAHRLVRTCTLASFSARISWPSGNLARIRTCCGFCGSAAKVTVTFMPANPVTSFEVSKPRAMSWSRQLSAGERWPRSAFSYGAWKEGRSQALSCHPVASGCQKPEFDRIRPDCLALRIFHRKMHFSLILCVFHGVSGLVLPSRIELEWAV